MQAHDPLRPASSEKTVNSSRRDCAALANQPVGFQRRT
jgi:hypothetical protein